MVMVLGGSGTVNATSTMTLSTNNTGRVNVDANGNVGIGTSTPSANVEVSGRSPKLWISETGTADTVELFLKQSGTTGEGLKLTYDSDSGDSTINNVYNLGNLYLQTNSNTKIIIDSSGRVRKPYQPAFYAWPSASVSYSNLSIFTFDNVVENQGGHFNGSLGRFTAPVAGRYMFNFHTLTSNDGAHCDHRLYINGVNNDQYGGYAGNWSGHKPAQSCWLVRLSAGDYVDVRAVNTAYVYSAPHTNFNGFLIG